MRTEQKFVVETLATAYYKTFENDENFKAFKELCIHDEVITILAFDNDYDNEFKGNYKEAENFFLNEELPDQLHMTIDEFMCKVYEPRWYGLPEGRPLVFGYDPSEDYSQELANCNYN